MNDIVAGGRSKERLTIRGRVAALENLVREFLGLDDWSDELIAPRSLIERARLFVPEQASTQAELDAVRRQWEQRYSGDAPALSWSPTLDCGKVNHAKALKAVAQLNTENFQGHADWRLPEIRELLSLVDYTRCNPAIDTAAFPDTKSDWYWSSSSCADAPGCAWIVHFYGGYAGWYNRSNDAFVRAVRGPSARASQ